jgi:transcriptional regulator with XRE-family HTH domain
VLTLYERLKNARENLNLTQSYVSNQLGINRTSLVQIEMGKRKVSSDELEKFSLIYGMSTDELIHGIYSKEPAILFARTFNELTVEDQQEILNLMEFKKQMKEKRRINVQ